MIQLIFIFVYFTSVFGSPIPGMCDEAANECMSRLSQLTSFSQCGMPPSTAVKILDPESLDWGICACPKLLPIFECFKKAEGNCLGAKQYIKVYGDQVDKGCKVVDWALKLPKKKFQFF